MDVLFSFIAFLKTHALLHFAFLHAAATAIPQETLHLLPLCTHHHCVPFQAHLLLSVYLCVVRSSISPLGFCAGINQRHHMQEAGTLAHATRLMMERIKKGEEWKRMHASASWTNAPSEHVTRWTEEKRGFLHSATMLPSLACVLM